MMNARKTILTVPPGIALGLLALLTASCGGDVNDAATEAPAPAREMAAADFELGGDAERGAKLYARFCASCHGRQGAGDGPAGLALDPPPTDFTAAELDAERAYLVVRDGGMAAGLTPTMAPFKGALDEQELRDVVAYVLSLAE